MYKYFFIILFLPSLCFAGGNHQIIKMMQFYSASSSEGTDYTADANCMAAYYMNNNGGDETDRSGEAETLTHSSAPPTSATVPSGFSGTSRDLESGDPDLLYHADGGSTDIFGTDQELTIATWINPESANNGDYHGVVAKWEAGTNNWKQYLLSIYGTAANEYKVLARISSDGSTTTDVESTTTNYATGVWHHIALVYNDIDLRVYVDGSLHCTPGAHTAGIGNLYAPFQVGAIRWNEAADDHFDGLIDEVIVFDRALSATEIENLYNDGISGNKGGND